jgi:hypothetical protein
MEATIESTRMTLQNRLDAQKTCRERNRLGQFATPKELADSIVREAGKYLKDTPEIRFLEPAIGTGVFYSALNDSDMKEKITFACGYEIDEHYALPSIDLWRTSKLKYVAGDFLTAEPPENDSDKFNLIISNPPYIRHHYIESSMKLRLGEIITRKFSMRFSGLTGLYCYFMALSALWLQKNGTSVWLIPNEFLDVNYGEMVKSFLLNKVKLLRIHRFKLESLQFSDALVTSVVVFFTTGNTTDSVVFTMGDNINQPAFQKIVPNTKLSPNEKWSTYFKSETVKARSLKSIGDFFSVKRGISTGSNKHFILTEEQADALNVSHNYLKPILPSPKFIKNNIIEQDEQGHILDTKNLFLLNITCPEHEINKLPEELVKYLDKIYCDIKNNYIIRNRAPWYKQEYRDECPLLMTYMGRDINEPFRLLLNNTKAIAPNVYLMLYPRFNWQEIESHSKGFMMMLHKEMQKISHNTYITSGRVYGGGLFKIEPRELMNTPVDNVISEYLLELMNIRHKEAKQLALFY